MTSADLSTADITRKFEDYLRSPEASMILREAVRDAASRVGSAASLPDEAAGMIRLLAARSSDTREDVLLKALTLYGLALDAIEKGNSLAILNRDDEIVREITGFESEEAASRPVGR